MKLITFLELIQKFDPEVHERVLESIEHYDAKGLILFQNVDLGHPECGHELAVPWGNPENTFPTIESAEGKSIVSWRYKPQAYCQFGELTGAAYEVNVGNIGNIEEPSLPRAIVTWIEYKRQSEAGEGRAAGEPVALLIDGEPVPSFDFAGSLAEAEQD